MHPVLHMALVMCMGEKGKFLDSLKVSLEMISSPVSIHSKMLVFQVLYCSFKPGEAFMAYSLRSDIRNVVESIKSKIQRTGHI